MSMTRSEIAAILKDAVHSYWAHKRYSCFSEIAVCSWGKLRADVLALNLRGQIILSEIKSSKADYVADKKWRKYLDYCDRMYLVMPSKTFRALKVQLLEDLRGTGVGVMVLDPVSGYLTNAIPAKLRNLDDQTRFTLITRMAWRNGVSRRFRRRRVRHFIT